MGTVFIPKRPHKKSRGGCKTCKTKKIKCDEVQPRCTFCEKRDISCNYSYKVSKTGIASPINPQSPSEPPSPAESSSTIEFERSSMELISLPTISIVTNTGTLSPTDLRMIHHWSVATSMMTTFGASANTALQVAVPQLAFGNDFLLNAILGLASQHMQYLQPNSITNQRQVEIYRGKAISGFRDALSKIQPGTASFEAALIMSILMVVLCTNTSSFEENKIITLKWFLLYKGLQAVIKIGQLEGLEGFSVSPIFRREITPLNTPPLVPTILINMMSQITPSDPDYPFVEHYCKILDQLGALYGSLRQDGLTPNLFVRVIAWPSFSNPEFTQRAQEESPRALVIVAHYVLFVKLLKGLWWMEGVADRDLDTIFRILDPIWAPYLAVQMQARYMEDREEIRTLLLG